MFICEFRMYWRTAVPISFTDCKYLVWRRPHNLGLFVMQIRLSFRSLVKHRGSSPHFLTYLFRTVAVWISA
jgi:hypothetical protein